MKKENTVLSVLCIVLVILSLVLGSELKTAKADIKAKTETRAGTIDKEVYWYDSGHGDGYDEGYEEGETSGKNEGFDDGYDEGFLVGYEIGYDDASNGRAYDAEP